MFFVFEKTDSKPHNYFCNRYQDNFPTTAEIIFCIKHNNKTYNSLFDDILYFMNKSVCSLSTEMINTLLLMSSYGINSKGIGIRCHITSNMCISTCYAMFQVGNVFIREPEDPRIETIKEVTKY